MDTTSRFRAAVRRGVSGDDGGMVTVEVLILFISFFMLLISLVQVALIYSAKQAALAAAEQGVKVTAANATVTDQFAGVPTGIQAAKDFAASTAGSILTVSPDNPDPTVTGVAVSTGPNAISGSTTSPHAIVMTVRGSATMLVPGLTLTVDQTVVGTVEAFTYRGSR